MRSGPVGVNLETIPVGIVEIERFADGMIGHPAQRVAGLVQLKESPSQISPAGKPKRHMDEARWIPDEPDGG